MNVLWAPRNAYRLHKGVLRRARTCGRVRDPAHWRQSIRSQHTISEESNLPRLVQPSVWDSIVPRSLRKQVKTKSAPGKKKPSNPANYFIWIYIFIGSQAIRILGLKNEFDTYMRKADLKLAQLREVVEKLQRGEEVDVEKALGTGDEVQEREWEEAMQELQNEERLWQKSRKQRREERERLEKEQQDANPVNGGQGTDTAVADTSRSAAAPQAPGFY